VDLLTSTPSTLRSAETPVLELQQLFERCLGNLPLVDRLISGFQKSLAEAVERIEAAQRGGEWRTLELAAHRLKGEAANLGAAALRDVAGRLESAAGSESPLVASLIQQLAAAAATFQATAFTFDSLPRTANDTLTALARLRKGAHL